MNEIYKIDTDKDYNREYMSGIYDLDTGLQPRNKDFIYPEFVSIENFPKFDEERKSRVKKGWKKIEDDLKKRGTDEATALAQVAAVSLQTIAQIYLLSGMGILTKFGFKLFQGGIRQLSNLLPPYQNSEIGYREGTTFYNDSEGEKKHYNTTVANFIKDINYSAKDKIKKIESDKYTIKESDLYKNKNAKKEIAFADGLSFLDYLKEVTKSNDDDYTKIASEDLQIEKLYKVTKSGVAYSIKTKYDPPSESNIEKWTDKQKEFLNEHSVDFLFEDLTSNLKIYFENTITNMTDSTSINWDEKRLSGRPDSYSIYSGASRSSNINFILVATTKDDINLIKEKVDFLKNMCFPKYINKRPTNPFFRITVGNFVKNQLVKINSLLINPDEEMGWQITNEDGRIVFPYKIDITMDYTILYDTAPNFANDGKYFNI